MSFLPQCLTYKQIATSKRIGVAPKNNLIKSRQSFWGQGGDI